MVQKEKEYKGVPEGFFTVKAGAKTIRIRIAADGETPEVLKNEGNGEYTTREATVEDILLYEEVMKEGRAERENGDRKPV